MRLRRDETAAHPEAAWNWKMIWVAAAMVLQAAPAAASSAFTYQGRLALNGGQVTATCQMRFRLFDAPAGGAQAGATIGPQEVSVEDGLFSLPLDFGGAALGTGNRWLEVAVDCGGGLIVLAPRQALTAAPYAYFADEVGPDGVGTAQLENDAVTSAKIDDGTIGASDIDATSVQRRVTGTCAGGSISGIALDGTVSCVSTGDITAVSAGSGLTGGGTAGAVSLAVGFGGTGSASSVARSDHDHVGQAWSGEPIALVGPFLLPVPVLLATYTGMNGIGLQGRADQGSAARGVRGDSVEGTGVLGRATGAMSTGVHGESTGSNGTGVLGEAGSGGSAVGVSGTSATGTGVRGEAAGASKSAVVGVATGSGGNGVEGIANTGAQAFGLYGRSTQGYGVVGTTLAAADSNDTGPAGVEGNALANGGVAVRGAAIGASSVGVYGSGADGVVGFATGDCAGDPVVCAFRRFAGVSGSSVAHPGVRGRSESGQGVVGSSGTGTAILAQGGTGPLIRATVSTGIFSENLRFQVSNAGNVTADGSISGGGADFAEMLPAAESVEPGDVLIIGTAGKLALSREARDARVAGVHSTQPGFVGGAGADEGDLTGKIPLAVVGVVPVKATADNGAIAPGDLLVSSSKPGRAMKADSHPTVGTVIGKALEGLEAGDGAISALIVLQ